MLEELETELPAAAAAAPDLDVEQSSSTKSKRFGRKPLPEHLPRREVRHEPSCACPACGGEMRKVGEDVTEILDYIPGHFEVIKHIRPAFSAGAVRAWCRRQCSRCPSNVASPVQGFWRMSSSENTAIAFRCTGSPASMHAKASSSIAQCSQIGSARRQHWSLLWSRRSPTTSWRPSGRIADHPINRIAALLPWNIANGSSARAAA